MISHSVTSGKGAKLSLKRDVKPTTKRGTSPAPHPSSTPQIISLLQNPWLGSSLDSTNSHTTTHNKLTDNKDDDLLGLSGLENLSELSEIVENIRPPDPATLTPSAPILRSQFLAPQSLLKDTQFPLPDLLPPPKQTVGYKRSREKTKENEQGNPTKSSRSLFSFNKSEQSFSQQLPLPSQVLFMREEATQQPLPHSRGLFMKNEY